MCGCESWTIKKTECWRIDASELWCWRRLLRVPWTARRSNQSVLKEIRPEYSLEGLLLKLKLQYFGHLMWRTVSLEKTLMLGNIEGRWKRGRQRMRRLEPSLIWWMCVLASSGSWWWRGKPSMLQSMGLKKVGHDWATELNWYYFLFVSFFFCGGELFFFLMPLVAYGIVVPQPEIKPGPQQWKHQILTTKPPGNFPVLRSGCTNLHSYK